MSNAAASSRARSCTGCRQVKLACDARRTAPQPCSRCRNKGLQCKFDNNFKRIPMRRVAQEISNEIHKLVPATSSTTSTAASSTSPPRSNTHVVPSITYPANIEYAGTTHLHRSLSDTRHVETQSWLNATEHDYYQSYQLGSLVVDGGTIVALMKHFEHHYLPHAPFLPNIASVASFSVKFPILFWTMVLVAAREYNLHEGLYEQICVVHGAPLSEITQTAIHNVETIHALLLLCLWPIPRVREKHDPSWNYIGLATNAAMFLDCHRPLFAGTDAAMWKGLSSYQTAGETGTQRLAQTWISCFQMGARLSAYLGMPPPLAAEAQLQSVTRAVTAVSSSITDEQKTMVEILKLSCLSTSEVDYVEELHTRFSLIQMFDAQLDALHQSSTDHWTTELDITWLTAKLYLYALLLTINVEKSTENPRQIANRHIILLRGEDAAIKLISQMTQLSNSPVNEGFYPAGKLTFYPKHYFTSLLMAADFLFRFLVTYQGISQQDSAIVVNGLTDAHRIFQSFPDHRDTVKAAIHIQHIVELIRNPDHSSHYPLDKLVITSRLGASVRFDAGFRSTRTRNRDPSTGASPPVSNWLMVNDDPLINLPLTPEQKAVRASVSASSHSGMDDGSIQQEGHGVGLWTQWDHHMQNFEVDDFLLTEMLSQIDPGDQT